MYISCLRVRTHMYACMCGRCSDREHLYLRVYNEHVICIFRACLKMYSVKLKILRFVFDEQPRPTCCTCILIAHIHIYYVYVCVFVCMRWRVVMQKFDSLICIHIMYIKNMHVCLLRKHKDLLACAKQNNCFIYTYFAYVRMYIYVPLNYRHIQVSLFVQLKDMSACSSATRMKWWNEIYAFIYMYINIDI